MLYVISVCSHINTHHVATYRGLSIAPSICRRFCSHLWCNEDDSMPCAHDVSRHLLGDFAHTVHRSSGEINGLPNDQDALCKQITVGGGPQCAPRLNDRGSVCDMPSRSLRQADERVNQVMACKTVSVAPAAAVPPAARCMHNPTHPGEDTLHWPPYMHTVHMLHR